MSFIFGIIVGVIISKMKVEVEKTDSGDVKSIQLRWGKIS